MKIPDFTATASQDEIIGPIFFEKHRKEVLERMQNDTNVDFLADYTSSLFQDFESISEQKLVRSKMISDSLQMHIFQILSLMGYHRAFTLLKIFSRSS